MENYILLFWVGRHDKMKKKEITVFTEQISRNCRSIQMLLFVFISIKETWKI